MGMIKAEDTKLHVHEVLCIVVAPPTSPMLPLPIPKVGSKFAEMPSSKINRDSTVDL